MQIKRLRIINYKSFDDSGWIEFTDAFNVAVGKNSAGKTALLEAFRLNRNTTRDHLSLKRRRGAALPGLSTFEFEVTFAENELKDTLLRTGQIDFPVTSGQPAGQEHVRGRILIDQFFSAGQSITLPSHFFPRTGLPVMIVGKPLRGE